jgi:hypothetical protein
MNRYSALAAATALSSAVATAAMPSAETQAGVSLTVYQQGVALVRDERTVDLGLGPARLLVPNVSREIVPGSALVSGQGGLTVQSIREVTPTLTAAALLERHIGRPVTVLWEDRAVEQGVLVGVDGERPIVRIGERIEIGGRGAHWRLALDSVPDELTARHGLVLELDNSVRGPQSLELVYLSRGLGWQADYVGGLDAQSSLLRLNAWATISNDTGTRYRDAQVQLLAGDVNQQLPQPAMMRAESAAADLPAAAVFDYHLYTLEAPLTLLPGQRTQVSLFGEREVPVLKEYRLSGDALAQPSEPQPVPVTVHLLLENTAPALGQPLPAGTVRIYGEGPQGQLQLLGQDRIAQTASGQSLELLLGSAFDVTAERMQTSYQRIDPNTVELGWQLRLRNAKDTPVRVAVREHLAGDWRLLEASQPPRAQEAHRLQWEVEVPANGEQTLNYRVQVRFPEGRLR